MLLDSNEQVVKSAVIALYNIYDIKIIDEIIDNPQMPDNAKTAAVALKDELEEDEDD